MRIPVFQRYRRGLAGLGLFLCGMVVGSAVYMSMHQYSYSLVHAEKERLKVEKDDLQKNLENMNNVKNRQAYISSIDIVIEQNEKHPIDIKTEGEIIKSVRKDLSALRGKPVARVKEDLPIYRKLIDNKVYVGVFERDYMVEVKSVLVIQSELTFYIAVRDPVRN
ncbi:hypothetical protein [Paenibacillus sp. MBLB4367]|uniref:hypothetical protein n=1 Tax=Paenibacillus sp. MBLB4367 TaxID=3384767 RepID=UPI0039084099